MMENYLFFSTAFSWPKFFSCPLLFPFSFHSSILPWFPAFFLQLAYACVFCYIYSCSHKIWVPTHLLYSDCDSFPFLSEAFFLGWAFHVLSIFFWGLKGFNWDRERTAELCAECQYRSLRQVFKIFSTIVQST